VTVIEEVPAFPSLVAMIVAVPGDTAVTTPVTATVAIAALLDDQPTRRPVNTLLLASFVSAVSCSVEPSTRVAVSALRVTEATGIAVTVIEDAPLFPSLVPVIVAVPTKIAVTTPVDDTLATSG
jgi:hypothetical protein